MPEEKKVSKLTELALAQFGTLQQAALTRLTQVASEDEGVDLKDYALDPNGAVWVRREELADDG